MCSMKHIWTWSRPLNRKVALCRDYATILDHCSIESAGAPLSFEAWHLIRAHVDNLHLNFGLFIKRMQLEVFNHGLVQTYPSGIYFSIFILFHFQLA